MNAQKLSRLSKLRILQNKSPTTKINIIFETFLGAMVDTTTPRTSMHNSIAGGETVETHGMMGGAPLGCFVQGPPSS